MALQKIVLEKGSHGQLDDIYDIQGILPSGAWEYPRDEDGFESPDSDEYIMIKTVTIKIEVKVKD